MTKVTYFPLILINIWNFHCSTNKNTCGSCRQSENRAEGLRVEIFLSISINKHVRGKRSCKHAVSDTPVCGQERPHNSDSVKLPHLRSQITEHWCSCVPSHWASPCLWFTGLCEAVTNCLTIIGPLASAAVRPAWREANSSCRKDGGVTGTGLGAC